MRLFGYLWAFPITMVGLAVVLLAITTGGSAHIRSGIVEAWGGWPGRFLRGGRYLRGGAALALGHVILGRDAECLARSHLHELAHVRQYERWGPLLPVVYWLIGGWLRIRGYHPYLDHPLEPPPG